MEINTYPSTSLRNILPRKPAAELRTLAKAYYVKGCSKMNKHDLAEAVCAELQVPERMEELLYVIDDPIWRMSSPHVRHWRLSAICNAKLRAIYPAFSFQTK